MQVRCQSGTDIPVCPPSYLCSARSTLASVADPRYIRARLARLDRGRTDLCRAPALITRRTPAQQRREREPNSVYAARRAKLAAQLDAPLILWGFTGHEESAQAYIFAQEDNFYYLTGHNEEGAGLIILPSQKGGATGASWDGPQEMLFLPPKNTSKEKWNGLRMSPSDPGIQSRTSFGSVQPYPEMRAASRKARQTLSRPSTQSFPTKKKMVAIHTKKLL